ncbi:MAG: hypothetical protein KBC81_02460 [Candidatus Pacebacteria bacterium]|nr:hypothetical protein [Candidatus Paceibacterota bacterium]
MAVLGNWREKYPQLPTLLANTVASKVIQIIKKDFLDLGFSSPGVAKKIKSWPKSMQQVAEWVFHILSGAVRSTPQRTHPVAIIIQESFADSLTQCGVKINEISSEDHEEMEEIVNEALPVVRSNFQKTAKEDRDFRETTDTILGTKSDWNILLRDANEYVLRAKNLIEEKRAARRLRGFRRFV